MFFFALFVFFVTFVDYAFDLVLIPIFKEKYEAIAAIETWVYCSFSGISSVHGIKKCPAAAAGVEYGFSFRLMLGTFHRVIFTGHRFFRKTSQVG